MWRIGPDETAAVSEAAYYEIMAIDFSSDDSQVYFVDAYENQIISMNADGGQLTHINLSFGYVTDIALGEDNDLYILDSGDNKCSEWI